MCWDVPACFCAAGSRASFFQSPDGARREPRGGILPAHAGVAGLAGVQSHHAGGDGYKFHIHHFDSGDGRRTQIYYDQWEDGYETNLALPTQASTQIWGDGNDANGIPPGYAHDPAGLPTGTVIILTNTVASSPRNPAQTYFDGRDRIAANKALVVTRAGWPSPTGPVFGGSAVVQATIDWGTNYVSPIGTDMAENLSKYTGFMVMASQNNTTVIIDPDGPGSLLAVTNMLNQGESWFYSGSLRRGATINASKPVEADLVCGDTVSTYAIDWFTLYPQSDWSGTYYTPLPSTTHNFTAYATYMYFYNNSAVPITVFYTNLVATNSFVLPANGGYKFTMPQGSGAVFSSAGGEKFTTLCTVAGSPANDTDYNWGFTPLPKGSLTSEAVAGWAPGTSDYSANGSPVWVTPTANTRIYVDYHGDHAGPLTDPNGNKYDTNFDLTIFQAKTIYVPNSNVNGTNDQTGLRIYTIDGTLLSAVWGEDPGVAGASNPYLDLGNPVLPFPVPKLTKSAVIVTDVPPAGLSIGDTLLYTVQVDNKGLLPLGNTVVVDAPPATLSYITNSATYNGTPIPDSTSGTAFPLDTPGYTIPIILSGGTSIFQYKATIVGAGSIVNAAGVPGYNITVTNTVPAIAPAPSLFVSKSILSPVSGVAGVGQQMQFNLQIINNGNVPLPNVSVTDNYPSNLFSYVSANVPPTTAGNGQITWTNLGTLAIGADTNLIVTLLVTNVSPLATNFATAASPGNTTNTGNVTFTNLAAPVAAVTVNKTILSPTGAQAGIGQAVSFNLQVFNSGYLALTNLSLTDNFPRTNFNFISASVTPDVVTTNSLTWTNLGTFAIGQITNIAVNFIVTNYSAFVTNFAVASAIGGATNTNSAVLQISRSGLSVSKTILSPTNQPVPLGSNVVFRIVIRNSGQLAITNLPFEDTFSAGYLQYVSATLAPNSIAPGDLFWTNLAGAFGMVTNAVITNDITMKVVGGATPANNTAAANFAVDVNSAAVAPSSSTIGVNTAAGLISGNVYSDNDQSGSLTAGDAPLQNVILTLYTDPNADGNPADGTQIQTIPSDANGYYELLNLSTGAYVVVETILPGYTGTAPANNRLGVVISSLTAATNRNFFQYQVPTTNYATVNGTVWNDVNGVGFFQAGDTGLTNVQVDLVQDLNTNGIVDAGETAVQSVFTGTGGTYFFSGVAPGRYVIREIDLPGYISTGDTQGTNDNQIALNLGNGVTTNSNDFFDFYFGLGNTNSPPVAVPDFTNTLENTALTITPLLNDNAPGGFALTITNVAATNGIATIVGGTNVSFTPTLYFTGTATIGYTVTNANGKSTSLITVTVLPVADLRIGKTGPASVLAVSNLTYSINVTNFGPAAASSVIITDTLPNGVSFSSASGNGANNSGVVTWSIANLSSNQVTNVTVTVTAPASGCLTNVANVGSPTSDPTPTNNFTPPVITAVTPLADLVMAKTGPANVNVASSFTYNLFVTNLGPSSASSVTVTDALPNGVTFSNATAGGTNLGGNVVWNLGTLAALQVTNFTLTVIAPVSSFTLTNLARVSSPTGDTNVFNNTNPPVITTVLPFADVSITKTGPAGIIFGTNYNYQITVSNAGPSTATSLLVTDSLPVGLAFVTSTPLTTTNASNQVIWNLGSLLANTASNLQLTVISTQRGSLTNFASGGSPTPDPTPTNNVTPPVVTLVTNFPPLANPDSYAMTENTTNTLSPLVNDSVRTPGGSLTIISVTPTNGTASISGTNVIFIPTLNFVGIATIGYTITDNVGGTNSSIITVTVTNIPPLANPDAFSMAEDSTNTFSPLTNDVVRTPGGTLSIISVSPTNGTASISGTNVTFIPTLNFVGVTTIGYTITDGIGGANSSVITVTVTNQSPIAFPQTLSTTENTALPITLTGSDPVSRPLTFIIVGTPGGGTLTGLNTNTGAVIYTPTNNFTGTDTFVFRVNNGVNNSSNATITISVTPTADLLVQQSGPASGVAGNNLVFTVAVTNLGPASATNVVVTNQIDSGYTFVSASSGGGTNGNFVTWTIPTLPANGKTNLTVTLLAMEGGTFTNLASGSNLTPDLNATNNNGSLTNAQVITTVSASANLAIVKTGPANISATGSVLYNLNVTNSGPSTATGVIVTDSLPANVTFVSASGNGTTNGNLVTWNLGTLANGATSNLTVTVTAPTSGSLTNVASLGSPTPDPMPTNNVTPPVVTIVTTIADLAVGKSGAASSALGVNFQYQISVTNLGPSTAANFAVTDSLPAGIIFVSSVPLVTTNAASQVIWTNLGTLALNATTNLTLTVKAVTRGAVTNIATVGGPTIDPTPTNNTSPPVVTSITNRPPLAVDDAGSTPKNIAVTVPVLVNDSDPDGDALTIVSVSPTNGTANISGTNVVFTPATDFTGTAFIGYTITDGFGGTNSALIIISVTNRPPAAVNDSASTSKNVAVTIPVLVNDSDVDGDALTIVSVAATNGFASISGTNVVFTPTNNFLGTAFIGYTISDGFGGTASALITVTVTNRAPVAVNDSTNTAENVAVTIPVLVNDTDPDGDALTIISVSPTNGTAIISGTNVVFTPATNFVGTATVGYGVTDDFGGTNFAVITIGVTNRPPVATPDSYAVTENTTNALPVLVNDVVNTPGGTLTIISVTPTNGAASISGTNIIFIPTLNFLGTATIGYVITDGIGGTNSSLITINVTNRPPVAVNDSGSTPKNVAVTIPALANDSDPDGNVISLATVTPTNGLAIISGTNVVFTPTNNFLGTAFIGYTITDGNGGTSAAVIAILVTNRAPVAVNDSGSTPKNVAVTIPALANDSDPDGDALTIISVSPTNGAAIISGTNVVFTPATNFLGTATIGYRITDGFGGTNSALITINVTNRPPVAVNDSASTPKNIAVTIPVLANDSDPDGDALTIISVTPTNGFASINGTNVVFTPTNNFLGTTFIGYGIRDNFGGTNFAIITVTVTNRAPLAVNDSASTPKNVAVTIPALANDSDPDGDALTIVSVAPTNGTANISGTNVVFTPANNFIGTAFIGYTITDGFGGTNSALITVNVTNRPPVANAQSTSTPFNTAKPLTLTGSDPDSDPLTFIIVGSPANGVLSLLDTNSGAVTYTPTNNFTGTDTFTFRVNDGTANSALATVSITVGTPVIADLAVFKTGPTNSTAGSNLVYSITVTNLGTFAATNVIVSDTLPAGFTFISATPTNSSLVSNVVSWSVFKLAANAKTNFTLTAVSLEGGTFTNFATATSDAYDPNPTNNNGTATNSQVRTVIAASADVQVFKDGGTNVAAGGTVNYVITATNAGPSTATNVVVQDNLPAGSTFQNASGSYTFTNNVVTWAALTLTNGAAVNYTIALTAPASGQFTNIALATSPTPDPNLTNNNGSVPKSRVATKVVPSADLIVLLYGPTNAVQGSNFVYSLILSNAGPSVASNAITSDQLPTNFVFVSATSGGVFSNGIVRWPKIAFLPVGSTSNYFVTVNSPFLGTFTNIASAVADTLDPNPTNNTGVAPASQALTTVSFAQFAWLAGTPIFNPQTGLYEETVVVTNTGNGTVAGFQLYVTILTTNVYLWNATGTNASGPFVQYSYPLDPSNHVSLALEFYDPLRVAFTNTLRVVPIIPGSAGVAGTNGFVGVNNIFTDTRTNGTRFVIEFPSTPGSVYTVIYSSDLVNWKVATPSVPATANVTQWYDDGPPKTESAPMSVTNRFYRVIKN